GQGDGLQLTATLAPIGQPQNRRWRIGKMRARAAESSIRGLQKGHSGRVWYRQPKCGRSRKGK
ncbi:MAG TPA: hypothetical protein VJQ54_03740, partial [Candidatus Sulfotelmatobacter sp.]|nr:hypothetical protein [Candidatus Sulfotelmatobacter sp.]